MPLGLPTDDEARHRGARLGEGYPTIWDPDEVVVRTLSHRAAQWLGEFAPRRSAAQGTWLTILTVCAAVTVGGAVAAGVSVWLTRTGVDLPPISRQNLAIAIAVWLVALLGIALAIIGNAVSRTRAATRRARLHNELHRIALDEGVARVDAHRVSARTFGSLPPAPGPQPFGISERGAVDLAAAWLQHLGCAPTVYPARADGVDIRFGQCLARVAGRGEDAAASVRELAGSVSAVPQSRGIAFFTREPEDEAVSFADRAGIALLVMDPRAGSLHGANLEGQEIMKVSQRTPSERIASERRPRTAPVPVVAG